MIAAIFNGCALNFGTTKYQCPSSMAYVITPKSKLAEIINTDGINWKLTSPQIKYANSTDKMA